MALGPALRWCVPVSLAGSYLVLETTNQCSLACVHCTVSEGTAHPHHRNVGFLPLALANAVMDDLIAVGARFDALIPFWLGEPLIHPDFGAIYQAGLRAAARGVFGRVELHTNATHLGRDRIRIALNQSPIPQTWHLSLDAATRGTYAAVKGRDCFDEVEANVLLFLDERNRSGACWPRPVFQFIVGENNAEEVPAFRKRWETACRDRGIAFRTVAQAVPSGDDAIVFFRQLDAPTPALQASANQVFRDAMAGAHLPLANDKRTPPAVVPGPGVCACFWKSPVIGWDGRVTTCTRDNRLENVLGSVAETAFSTLWWGSEMRESRRRVAAGNYAGLPACHGCYIPQSANYSGITPSEITGYES